QVTAVVVENRLLVATAQNEECRDTVHEETSRWKTCKTTPIANAPVTLKTGGLTISGRTGTDGEASLDLDPIAKVGLDTDPEQGLVVVQALTGTTASVSVSLKT